MPKRPRKPLRTTVLFLLMVFSGITAQDWTVALPTFTMKFIVVDEGLNLTLMHTFLQATLEAHLKAHLLRERIRGLVVQTPGIGHSFLGNDTGIPVALLDTTWNGLVYLNSTSSADDKLLAEFSLPDETYASFQGENLLELMRRWGQHPILDVIAKVLVEDDSLTILDEASVADAFPDVNGGAGSAEPQKKLSKSSIWMTLALMVVMMAIMLGCILWKRRKAQQEELRLRQERRAKWQRRKELRDQERAAKAAAAAEKERPGTDEWMDEMTDKLMSIAPTPALKKQNSWKRTPPGLLLQRENSLPRPASRQGSMENLFAISEGFNDDESSSFFTSDHRSDHSSMQKGAALQRDRRVDDEPFISQTVYL